MKTLLINPNKTFYEQGLHNSKKVDIGLPLGLLYLASVLDKNKLSVRILDNLMHERSKYFEDSYGLTDSDFKEVIIKSNPEIVGITAQFTAQSKNVILAAKLTKEVNKDIKVVVGGPHATIAYSELLSCNFIDVVVLGEGEDTLLDLAKNIPLTNIKGIAYKKDGQIKINEKRKFILTLDELPLPAYHLIDMDKYLDLYKQGTFSRYRDKTRAMPIITSRGCPYSCVFCSIRLHMGQGIRAHSKDYVITHIKLLVEKYSVKIFHFEDDNLTFDKKRFESIVDTIIQEDIDLSWDTPNGVRVDTLDYDLLKKMKASGCIRLTIAPESGDQNTITNIIHKSVKLTQVIGVAMICKKIRIPLYCFFIIGFPGETKKAIQNTLDFALMLNKKYDVNTRGAVYATPLLGTELFEICKTNNYFARDPTPENLATATQPNGLGIIKTKEFTPEEIKEMNLKTMRKGLFLYMLRVLKNPFKLPSVLNEMGGMDVLFNNVKQSIIK